MNEQQLKDKVKELNAKIKATNPKYAKKIAELKEELKTVKSELKVIQDNKPVLTKEVKKAINSALNISEIDKELIDLTNKFSEDIDNNSAKVDEIVNEISNAYYPKKYLNKVLIKSYEKEISLRYTYQKDIQKIVNKVVKSVRKSFKIITNVVDLNGIKEYSKITKDDLYKVLFDFLVMETISIDDVYDFINCNMKIR